ncbi:ABC transporter ATP-binding protein [Daejeonella sp.]|uniref:ABC transporter ATP-binding protein n=1 Tax=Daejeonella sp. TaxID=2805397 RepID=UPI0030BFE6EB
MASIRKQSSVIAVFKEFLNRYPQQFGLLFFFLVIEGAAAVLSMLAIIPMADYLIDSTLNRSSRITLFIVHVFAELNVPTTFWTLGGLFVGLNALKGVLEVAVRYAILKIKYTVIQGLFGDSLERFFKARWGFFSNADNGVLLNTLNKELHTIGDTLGHIATLMAQVIQLAVFLAVPLWLNPLLTVTVLGLSILFGIPFLFLNKLSYRLGKNNTETGNIAMGVLNELLQSARLVLGFGKQKQSRLHYLRAFDKHIQVTLKSQTLATAIPKLFQPMGMVAVIVAIGFAIKSNVSISELTAIMWSFLATMPILAALLQGQISIQNFLPSYEQLVVLREKAAGLREVEGQHAFHKLNRSIEFKNVAFTYPGRMNTLVNVNLEIVQGQMTALIGESGSGKSTITDLVLGLQIPDSGEVLVDGVSLNDLRQNSFREKIGYVPQDPLLFNSSIRDNLLWASEQAHEHNLWEALRLANADKFVKELPNGIDTIVGDRGVRLSGGQRQRIALARALVRKPELLILDEATSALDSESERLIQQSIEQVSKDTTLLIVAHRLSTIAKADQVYVFSNGQVVEKGPFTLLSKRDGGILNGMLNAQLPYSDE